MSYLINQLKSEHQQISLLLSEVNNLGISTHEGQMKLIAAKNILVNHLKKEDAELYPILQIEAKSNLSLRTNLQILTFEMQSISKEAMNFFQKYESGGAGLEFGHDYSKFFSMLVKRVTKEEAVLYSEYERIKGEKTKSL